MTATAKTLISLGALASLGIALAGLREILATAIHTQHAHSQNLVRRINQYTNTTRV